MDRRLFLQSVALTGAASLTRRGVLAQTLSSGDETPRVYALQPAVIKADLPHYWEECMGSDRAAVAFREQWLLDLERAKNDVGVKSVRFHGLFDDEMGVWPSGAKAPNFLYVDMVFDAMVQRGVKPFVELGFMPGHLASGTRTVFFYRGNITPPKESSEWSELIRAFAAHCVERYGLDQVRTWKFEVWNEANLPFFWSGTQSEYFSLYRDAALALKSVDAGLQVGGPATAQAAWVADLLSYCAEQKAPIDFVTTHVYPDDPQDHVFGKGVHYPYEEVIPRALTQIRDEIKKSSSPTLPLYITEWSSQNPAFIAHTIKGCIGLADIMSYWTFDNVFEELGVPRSFLNSSFGLIGLRGVPRPSFNTFALLHKLGRDQIGSDDGPFLATKRKDGTLAVLLWNLIPLPPGVRTAMGDPTVQNGSDYASSGGTKTMTFKFTGQHRSAKFFVTRVDQDHGNLSTAYKAMGSPAYPTISQISELKNRSELPAREHVALDEHGMITLLLPPNGVALLESAS